MAAQAPDVQELQREVARLTQLVGAQQNTTELLVAQHRKEEKKNNEGHHLRKPADEPDKPFVRPADVPNRRYANLFAPDVVGQSGYPYALDLTEVYEPAYHAALAHPEPAVRDRANIYRYTLSGCAFQEVLSGALVQLAGVARQVEALTAASSAALDTVLPTLQPLAANATQQARDARAALEERRGQLRQGLERSATQSALIRDLLERTTNTANGIGLLNEYSKEVQRTALAPSHLVPHTVKTAVRAGDAYTGGFASTHPLLQEVLAQGATQYLELAQKAAVRAASKLVTDLDSSDDDDAASAPAKKRKRGGTSGTDSNACRSI